MTTPTTATGFRGSLSETPLPQVLRRIFLEGLKGTLSLVHGDETRHLFFEKGELRTATSSREGQRIGAFLKRRGWITDTDLNWALDTVAKQGRARLGKILVERGLVSRTVLDAEMRRLVEEIVFSTFAWDTGEYKYQASSGVLDPDVALTLSTAAVIVEGIRRLPESESFRERLGDGHRVPMLATDPMSRYQYLPLAPQEAYLLSRVDGILDVDSLLKITGTSRGAMAKILYGLVSCGIVEWKQDGAERPASGRGGFHGLNVEVAAQPSDRSPGHAELVKNTYRRIDWLTHYELLGVVREASPEKISEAYFERSRLFHPDLRHREDLARFEKELTAVFERMKKAYETLSDRTSGPSTTRASTRPRPRCSWPRRTRRCARSWRPTISGAPGSSSRTRTTTRPSRCCAKPCASFRTTPSSVTCCRRSSSRTRTGRTRGSRT